MAAPTVKLSRGIHVMHIFYRIDRAIWKSLPQAESKEALARLQKVSEANNAPSNPRLASYVNVGGKADLAFIIYAAELAQLSSIHRSLEACFPVGTLESAYTFLSVTELPEYITTEDDLVRSLKAEGLQEGTEAYNQKL